MPHFSIIAENLVNKSGYKTLMNPHEGKNSWNWFILAILPSLVYRIRFFCTFFISFYQTIVSFSFNFANFETFVITCYDFKKNVIFAFINTNYKCSKCVSSTYDCKCDLEFFPLLYLSVTFQKFYVVQLVPTFSWLTK